MICGWACPFGAIQELIYSLPILRRLKQKKLPFFFTNTIRAGIFSAMLLFLFGIVGGRKGTVIYHYLNPFNLFNLGHAYFLTRQYEEALTTLERALEAMPDFFPTRAFLAATFFELDRVEEACTETLELRKISPGTTLDIWRARLPYKNQSDLNRILTALRNAGMK